MRAEQLVAKKLRSMHGLTPEVQTRRLAGMLARKGYSGEVAWPSSATPSTAARAPSATDTRARGCAAHREGEDRSVLTPSR